MKESKIKRKSAFINGKIVKTEEGIKQVPYNEGIKYEPISEEVVAKLDADIEKILEDKFGILTK